MDEEGMWKISEKRPQTYTMRSCCPVTSMEESPAYSYMPASLWILHAGRNVKEPYVGQNKGVETKIICYLNLQNINWSWDRISACMLERLMCWGAPGGIGYWGRRMIFLQCCSQMQTVHVSVHNSLFMVTCMLLNSVGCFNKRYENKRGPWREEEKSQHK